MRNKKKLCVPLSGDFHGQIFVFVGGVGRDHVYITADLVGDAAVWTVDAILLLWRCGHSCCGVGCRIVYDFLVEDIYTEVIVVAMIGVVYVICMVVITVEMVMHLVIIIIIIIISSSSSSSIVGVEIGLLMILLTRMLMRWTVHAS